MTSTGSEPDFSELETLFVNNGEVSRIEAYLNRFNPIRTMRMERIEIRHSAILAWLLDPRETHGLGDAFLRAFLSEALRGRNEPGGPTALNISLSDLRDAEVRREWQHIDIFILLPRLGWAFVVENKFRSTQHEGQLAKYVRAVEAIFGPKHGKLSIRGIFLTLLDEEPQDPSYAPIRYGTVCSLLAQLISQVEGTIGRDVRVFLDHYVEIIRERTGMSTERTEMEVMARVLYRRHKKVFDFVMKHGATTDFVMAAEALFGEAGERREIRTVGTKEFVFDRSNNFQYSFVPSSWVEGLGGRDLKWPGCESWWAGYPLICWLQLQERSDVGKGQLSLFAEVGPIADHDFRSRLIESIKSAVKGKELRDVEFNANATKEGKKFSRFLKRNSSHIEDTQDIEEISMAMRKLMEKFEPCFDAIAGILPQFRKYGVTTRE